MKLTNTKSGIYFYVVKLRSQARSRSLSTLTRLRLVFLILIKFGTWYKLFILLICQASVANASVFTPDNIAEIQKGIGYDANVPIEGQGMPIEQAEALGSNTRQKVQDKAQDYECTKEHCEVGHTFSNPSTLARETEIEKAGFIKDENGVIQNNKGYLDKARTTAKEAKFDFLSGGYTDCKPTTETTTNSSEETCDQYFDTKQTGCMAQQIVEIDPKYTYMCHKKMEVKEKLCSDVLKNLTCKKNGECDVEGIILGSVEAGIEWNYDPGSSTLRLGSLEYYWNCGDNCQKISRVAKFKIKNKPTIKVFKLNKLFLNNLLQVTLNGSVVYNSLGGNKLEIIPFFVRPGSESKIRGYLSVIDAGVGKRGNCFMNHEKKIPDYVSIDLIPYLKEGQNEIILDLIYSFDGHIRIEIEARQHCCTEWVEEREEQCTFV